MKRNWGAPLVEVQEFVAQEYCANCGVYINGLHCQVGTKYGRTIETGKGQVGVWDVDHEQWHSLTGGCTTWIDENGNAWEEHGGTYQNDLRFIENGPASGQSQAEFLKSLGNGIHSDIVVRWTTKREKDYIHQGYLEVNGNHS